MKQADAPRIATVINTIYDNSKGKMIGVKQFPLTPIFEKEGFFSEDRVKIMDYCKSTLLFTEGERAGLKYKWKGDMPDAERIAQDIINFYDGVPSKKTKVIRKEILDVEKIDSIKKDMEKLEMKKHIKVEKAAGDRVYTLFENTIYQAYICKVTKMPLSKPIYDVLITFDGTNCLIKNASVFPAMTVLCDILQANHIKFALEAPLEIVKENNKKETPEIENTSVS